MKLSNYYKNPIMHFMVVFIIMFLLDMVGLYVLNPLFKTQVMKIQNQPVNINFLSAFLCYLVLVYVFYVFIVQERKGLWEAFILGFSIYAVYELTSKALFSGWEWRVVILDSLWGGILFSLTNYILIITK